MVFEIKEGRYYKYKLIGRAKGYTRITYAHTWLGVWWQKLKMERDYSV